MTCRGQFGSATGVSAFAQRFPRQAEELKRRLLQDRQDVSAAAQATRATRSLRLSTHPGAQPSGAPSLPEQFGRYRILKQLGQGGMGAVSTWPTTPSLDRSVALKVPHFTAADGPEVLERFAREAQAAAIIQHLNICPVFERRRGPQPSIT